MRPADLPTEYETNPFVRAKLGQRPIPNRPYRREEHGELTSKAREGGSYRRNRPVWLSTGPNRRARRKALAELPRAARQRIRGRR